MHAPHAREFRGLFDQSHGTPRPGSFLQQHADIHPLIAQRVRHVTQNAILEHIVSVLHPSPQVTRLTSLQGNHAAGFPPQSDRHSPPAQAERDGLTEAEFFATPTFKSVECCENSSRANKQHHAAPPNITPSTISSPYQAHLYFQFGNGCADDFQADTINSRTNFRRRKSCSSILSSASESQSYHSGGICP